MACEDRAFCLSKSDDNVRLRRNHNYYYQGIGQIALTKAGFCDFVVWTEVDIHIERLLHDTSLWTEMQEKLAHFYYTSFDVGALDRLCNIVWKIT